MVTELPVACLVLAAAQILVESRSRVMSARRRVSVCEESYAPRNTLSNTNSLPLSPLRVTVGAAVH